MSTKAIEGKNDFLFLNNDSNAVLEQIQGKRKLSPERLKLWCNEVEYRSQFCKKYGANYFYFIAPNKHCIYSKFLPEKFNNISNDRVACQLDSAIDNVFYPYELLKQKKNKYLIYHKTDTHWNSVGCIYAWDFFSEIAGLGKKIIIKRINERSIVGDLGNKFNPYKKSKTLVADVNFQSKECFNNFLNNRGKIRIFENNNKNLKTAIIFGDSFSNSFLQYIAEYFSKLYFFHTPLFSENIIKDLRPDIVINCNIERFVYNQNYRVNDIYTPYFINYFEEGKYDLTTLKNFLNTKYNPIYPSIVYDKMRKIALDYVEILQTKNAQNIESLLNFDNIEENEDLINSLIHLKPMPIFFYKKYMLVKGLKNIERAVDLSNHTPKYHLQLAHELNGIGQIKLAIAHINKAISIDRTDISFYSHLIPLIIKIGDFDGAEKACKKALSLDPDTPFYHAQLSYIFTAKNQFPEAIEKIQDAIKLNGNNANFYNHLTSLMRKIGDFDGAEKACKKALSLDPDTPFYHAQLSYIFTAKNQFPEAIEKIQDAIKLNGNNVSFYNHLTSLMRKIGDFDGAEKACKKALSLDPDTPFYHAQLSYIFTAKNQLPEAIEKIQDAIKLNGNNVSFYNHFTSLMQKIGDFDGAEKACKKALSLDPDTPFYHAQLSYIFTAKNQFPEAIEKIQDAIKLNGNNATFYNHLTSLLRKIGDLDGAEKAQQKANSLN